MTGENRDLGTTMAVAFEKHSIAEPIAVSSWKTLAEELRGGRESVERSRCQRLQTQLMRLSTTGVMVGALPVPWVDRLFVFDEGKGEDAVALGHSGAQLVEVEP